MTTHSHIVRAICTPVFASALALGVLATACDSSASSVTESEASGGGTVSITAVVTSQYKSAVTVSTSGNSLVLRSSGVPDHATPYWGEGNALYETQITGHALTPGTLKSQTFALDDSGRAGAGIVQGSHLARTHWYGAQWRRDL